MDENKVQGQALLDFSVTSGTINLDPDQFKGKQAIGGGFTSQNFFAQFDENRIFFTKTDVSTLKAPTDCI